MLNQIYCERRMIKEWTSLFYFQCPGGSLQCYNGKCISYRDICDGVQDCSQNEDETDYIDCSKYGRGGMNSSITPMQ